MIIIEKKLVYLVGDKNAISFISSYIKNGIIRDPYSVSISPDNGDITISYVDSDLLNLFGQLNDDYFEYDPISNQFTEVGETLN